MTENPLCLEDKYCYFHALLHIIIQAILGKTKIFTFKNKASIRIVMIQIETKSLQLI